MALLGILISVLIITLYFCGLKAPSIFRQLGLTWRGSKNNATASGLKCVNIGTPEGKSGLQNLAVDMTDVTPTVEKHDNSKPANATQVTDENLMPPPPRPPRINPPPQTATSLRVPSTGPLPNRNPPGKSLTTQPASTSTLAPNARPRKKVILEPGHSPLDWAEKTRTTPSSQLSGVPFPQRITPSQLAWATGRKGKPAWSAYKGRVYNIAPYLKFHPGGEAELMRAAGRDAQPLFEEVHSWVNWENMLGACLVGFLVSEAEGVASRERTS